MQVVQRKSGGRLEAIRTSGRSPAGQIWQDMQEDLLPQQQNAASGCDEFNSPTCQTFQTDHDYLFIKFTFATLSEAEFSLA